MKGSETRKENLLVIAFDLKVWRVMRKVMKQSKHVNSARQLNT